MKRVLAKLIDVAGLQLVVGADLLGRVGAFYLLPASPSGESNRAPIPCDFVEPQRGYDWMSEGHFAF